MKSDLINSNSSIYSSNNINGLIARKHLTEAAALILIPCDHSKMKNMLKILIEKNLVSKSKPSAKRSLLLIKIAKAKTETNKQTKVIKP